MNWPVIWGIIKFEKDEQLYVPKNYFAGNRISVRFSKEKSFDSSHYFGCKILKLKVNEISFEIMCSSWRPKDLFNNDEEWCTSDLDYFSPDEIKVEEQQNFTSVSDVIFYKGEDGAKYTYTFDMLSKRLIDFQKVLVDIINITLGEELVEFCREPRCILEIQEFLGLRNKHMANAKFTMPLMKQGKLKFIYPQNPRSTLQRYLKSDIEFTLEMQKRIHCEKETIEEQVLQQKTLEFCTQPRTMCEIKMRLELGYNEAVRKKAIKPLLEQGKLMLKYPHNPNYNMQQYFTKEAADAVVQLTNENIIKFCKTPRSKIEIEKHFGIRQDLLYKSINPLIDANKLIYTRATRIGTKIINKKLVSNG